MREFAQAGVELIGAPAPRGHRRGDRGAGGGARRRRPRPRRDRARRRRPLPPAARPSSASRARRATRSSTASPTHDLVGLEAELSEVEGIGDEQVATCVALSQLRGGSEVLEQARGLGGAAVERATARLGETYEALERARRRRPGPDRPRPAARPRLLQRRDPRGLRPGARPRARRRRPLRRAAEALRRRPARRPASPSTWSGSTSPRWRRSRGGGEASMSVEVAGMGRAKADGPLKLAVPRGALFERDARRRSTRAGIDTAELRGDSRSLIFEAERDHAGDDAALRRAHLRRGRRRRRRHHRQGRAARAGRPRRLRAARPRLRPLPDGARRAPGRRAPGRVRSAAWG